MQVALRHNRKGEIIMIRLTTFIYICVVRVLTQHDMLECHP